MSPRDFRALHATTDLMMLAGEGEPDPDKRIEHGAKELRAAYFLARNAKAGMKFIAVVGSMFIAALQFGAEAWSHIKAWIALFGRGGA